MALIIISAAVTFGVACLLGPAIIPMLRRLKFGQSIKEIGPSWHKSKQGTPTMGGLIFIIPITLMGFSICYPAIASGDYKIPAVLLTGLAFGAVGFADDLISILKKQNLGLTGIQKLILQFLIAGTFLFYMFSKGFLPPTVMLPIVDVELKLGIWYYVLALPFFVYVVNAVNLTDGVDGLASSIMVPITALFAIIFYNWGAKNMTVISACVLGGCLAFLVFNFHPAKVFMGDTGSLFLGGILCAMGFCINPLIIIIAAFVYIFEALSVVIQVVVFKLTGKRVFKMSPIHHHFEMSGYKETEIVYLFTGITVLLCLASYFIF